MRILTPAKIGRLIKAIHAIHGGREVTSAVLLKSCAGKAGHTEAGAELLQAITACIGRRPNSQKLGHALKRMRDQRQGNLELVGDYSTNRNIWTYTVGEYGAGISFTEVLTASHERAEEAQQEFERKFNAARGPSRKGDVLAAEFRKQERRAAQIAARDEREEATFNGAHISGQHSRRRVPASAPVEGPPIDQERRTELQRLIRQHRLDTASITELEQIDALRRRRGQSRWEPGMSCNSADYFDHSSPRAFAAALVGPPPKRPTWNVF